MVPLCDPTTVQAVDPVVILEKSGFRASGRPNDGDPYVRCGSVLGCACWVTGIPPATRFLKFIVLQPLTMARNTSQLLLDFIALRGDQYVCNIHDYLSQVRNDNHRANGSL